MSTPLADSTCRARIQRVAAATICCCSSKRNQCRRSSENRLEGDFGNYVEIDLTFDFDCSVDSSNAEGTNTATKTCAGQCRFYSSFGSKCSDFTRRPHVCCNGRIEYCGV